MSPRHPSPLDTPLSAILISTPGRIGLQSCPAPAGSLEILDCGNIQDSTLSLLHSLHFPTLSPPPHSFICLSIFTSVLCFCSLICIFGYPHSFNRPFSAEPFFHHAILIPLCRRFGLRFVCCCTGFLRQHYFANSGPNARCWHAVRYNLGSTEGRRYSQDHPPRGEHQRHSCRRPSHCE